MILLFRAALIFITPLLFLGAFNLWPDVIDKEGIRYLATLFSIVWGGVLWIFAKLKDVATIEGLTARERERLQDAANTVRRRLWWMSGVCFGCAIFIFFLSAASSTMDPQLVALAAGLLTGVALSYLVLVPSWHEELQRFIDQVREREEQRKQLERALKDLHT